ncbi:MAG: PKD domain-containing protein, partial [Bacteroidota bacterium]
QSKVALTLKVAYAPYDRTYSDSLGVFIATDCNSTFRSVFFQGGEELATAESYQQAFIPAADEWKTIEVDLSAFAGQERVQVAIVSLSGYGNYLYIDDLKIAPEGKAAPNPDFVFAQGGTRQEICAGNQLSFQDRSSGNPSKFIWSFPGGTPASDTLPNPVVTYEKPGSYNVSLTVTNAGGTRTFTQEAAVTVRPLPAVRLDASKTEVCLGEEITLTVSGQGPFDWELGGDDPQPTGNQISLEPGGDATYRVETAPNSFGCVGTAAVNVRVGQGRGLKVDPPQTVVCLGESVKLEATGAQRYEWSPTESLSSSQSALVYASPNQSTTYTVMGYSPGCTTRQEVRIEVEQAPVNFQVSADQSQVCTGERVTLRASGAEAFRWSPVATLNRPDGSSVIALPFQTTRYTVTALSENGCEARKQIEIRAETQPDVVIRANQTRICAGEEVLLSANGATNFRWLPHPSLQVLGAEARAFPTEDTRYTVVGTNGGGCTDTAYLDISVNQAPEIELVASRETVCPGDRVVLTASGGSNYQWSPASMLESINGATATAVILRNQNYFVTAIDELGCRSEAQIRITVSDGFDALPGAGFNVSNQTTCAGQEVTFTSTSSNAVQYLWEFQGGDPSTSLEENPKVKFYEEGIHDVKL